MIKDDEGRDIIERRNNRREALEIPQDPPQDPELIRESPGAPVHADEDGFEYEPEMAQTSAEEDNNEVDLSQSNASPASASSSSSSSNSSSSS